jgi:hypothetical protein
MIDLQIFCDPERDYLSKPFSLGDYSYATNGHIALRMPRRDDVEQTLDSLMENVAAAMNNYIEAGQKTPGPLLPIPDGELPAWKSEPCAFCAGKGKLDHCPTCRQPCDCPECDGTGEILGNHPGVEIAPGAVVSAVYLGWIRELPSPRFRVKKDDDPGAQIYFEFDGGVGILAGRLPSLSDVSLVKKETAA